MRAFKTLDEILKVLKQTDLPVTKDKAITEKHYGIYAGKNKWQVKEEVGEEEFQKIRRSWDYQVVKERVRLVVEAHVSSNINLNDCSAE